MTKKTYGIKLADIDKSGKKITFLFADSETRKKLVIDFYRETLYMNLLQTNVRTLRRSETFTLGLVERKEAFCITPTYGCSIL